MEELPSLNWLIEQKFQIFDVANFDYKRAEGKPQKKSQQNFNKNGKVTRKRPRESLAVLIYQAMQFHKRKLTVAEISNYICNKYDYYRMRKHWTVSYLCELIVNNVLFFRSQVQSVMHCQKMGAFTKLDDLKVKINVVAFGH